MNENAEFEERLARCEDALIEGVKFKVTGGDYSPAIMNFEEAYELATREPRLPKPWPQIAAYRLAHICMRTAVTYEALTKVEELFQEAGRLGVEVLGPIPSIYRLAALHRLTEMAPTVELSSSCREARSRLFASLADSAHRRPWDDAARDRAAAVQGTLHNYLELASYFTGESYSELQGMSSPTGDLLLDEEWRIVGTHQVGVGRHVRLRYKLARAELDARAEADSADLMFELGDISVRESGYLWSRGKDPVQVSLRSLLLLLKYCRSPEASSAELERSVIPAGETGGTRLKDIAADLRASLGHHAEIDGMRVLTKGTRSEPARLNPDIRVAAMVHSAWLNASPPPLGRYERGSHL